MKDEKEKTGDSEHTCIDLLFNLVMHAIFE